jgi:hypothetical protein
MDITHIEDVEDYSASLHRTGRSVRQNLLTSETGLEGFSLIISRSEARFSPRHRHNFEQYRFQIGGTADYSKTGKLKTGMLGYFPEGVHYGPQMPAEEGNDVAVLVLQCGGASGSGYVNRAEVLSAAKELQKMGEFKDGVFHRNPGLPGKKKVEGSQAIWEHIMQRDLKYPKARYTAPILMDPEGFDWVPVAGEPGVSEKLMGVFSERQTGASFLKLDPGASHRVAGNRDIYFVIGGKGTVGDDTYGASTAVFLDRGETASFTAEDETEILHFSLPNLSGLRATA